MNPDSPQTPREEMEQRLTALLLGELSAEEAAALHRAMEQDGELAKLFARLHHTVGLVRETVASPSEPASAQAAPAKLSEARREKLLAHFKTIAPKEFTPEKRRARFTLVELAAVLVILGLLAAIVFPTTSHFKSKGAVASAVDDATARLAADKAFETAKTELAPQSERAPADLVLRNWDSADSRERLGYGLNRGEPMSVDFAASGIDAEEAAKPSAITPLPGKPSTPIVLPAQAGNYSYFAGGAAAGGIDALTLGGKTELGQSFYRIAPDSGGGGGAVTLSVTVTDSSREYGRVTDAESLLSKEIPVQYASPADISPTLQSLADTAVKRPDAITPLPARPSAGAAQIQDQTRANENSSLAFTPRPPVAVDLPQTEWPAGTLSVTNSTHFGGTGGGGSGGRIDGSAKAGAVIVQDSAELEAANEILALKPPDVELKARFAEISQNDNRALGFDWYLGSELNKGKDALTAQGGTTPSSANQPVDVLNEGVVSTLSGRAGGVNFADGATPSGLTPLGRSGKDSDSDASTSPVPDGGRIAPEPNVYGLDVVGYADAPTQSATSAGVGLNDSARRQSASIVLPGLAIPAETPPSSVAADEKKLPRDSLLIAALGRREKLPTKAESAGRALGGMSEVSQSDRAYFEKRRELEDLTEYRRLLTRKINNERTDLSLPRSAPVEIVEAAQADSTPSQSAWGKLRSAVGGDVERAAMLKVERDKSDIDEISSVGTRSNPYDPYFIQTESETIQSEAILGKVVAELKLDELWAKQKGTGAKLKTNEAIAMLRGRLDVRPRPNTTIMEIRAKSADPKEAAQIANAVAASYKKWRFDRGYGLVTAGVDELEKQSAIQDEKIRQAKVELERLRTELNISDADAGTDPTPIRKPSTNAPIPQPEIPTSENNFSTFSLNVSDVSFKLTAASLEKGQMPDAASVRSEEFINAFDYRDPEPAAGAPIAFAYERARYPFAHNRDLLRFSLKTAAAGRQAGRPLNIVLLLDNSGSMERADRVQIIREALRVLASQLQPQDKLSVIMFARTARLVADGISGDQAGEVAEQVSGITPQGGTNLEGAMNLAYQTAARHYLANGINRVVLLTDGAANLGDVEPESLKQKVETQRQQGIALDCFGIGWEGLNDDLLEVLSRNGDGRYGFINSPEEAATDFVGQLAGALKVAASDVKVQVEFNPKRVTAYRQIGYAKHQLTKEQFRDNTVDAAEIAAQEAGNALYTVEVNPAGSGPLCTVRVRYKVPGTTDYREQAWDVPYTGNAATLEQSSPAMRLAASASAFAEWLVASPFAGEVTPERVLGYLSGVPEVFGADARPKKLEWMIRQAKSLEGK